MTLLIATLLALTPVTAEQAKKAFPAVDLSDLTDQQRGMFIDVAADMFNYAGCQDTLALCLNPAVKDPHALRMAALVKQLIKDGATAQAAVIAIERYYGSFPPRARATVRSDDCPVEGKGNITIVEFSDYQCPHCAAAIGPLTELVTKERKGEVRLCSKYFPFDSHPRARIAALCAEYARSHGKFWEMNATLFANQENLEDSDLKGYAKQLGLDGDEMLKQVYSGKFDDAVEKQRREGIAIGVEATPSIFIDGRLYQMPPRSFYLNFAIDDEIQWKKEKGWHYGPAKAEMQAEKQPVKKVAKKGK